jgi:hypothetical protein
MRPNVPLLPGQKREAEEAVAKVSKQFAEVTSAPRAFATSVDCVFNNSNVVKALAGKKKLSDTEKFIHFFAAKSGFYSADEFTQLNKKIAVLLEHAQNGTSPDPAERLSMKELRSLDGISHNLLSIVEKNGVQCAAPREDFIDKLSLLKTYGSEKVRTFASCALAAVKLFGLLEQKICGDFRDGVAYLFIIRNSFLQEMGVHPWSHLTWGEYGHSSIDLNGGKQARHIDDGDKLIRDRNTVKGFAQCSSYAITPNALLKEESKEILGLLGQPDSLVEATFHKVLNDVLCTNYGYHVRTIGIICHFFVYLYNAVVLFFAGVLSRLPRRQSSPISEHFEVDGGGEIRRKVDSHTTFSGRSAYCSGYLAIAIVESLRLIDASFRAKLLKNNALNADQREMISREDFSFFRELFPVGVNLESVLTGQLLDVLRGAGMLQPAPMPTLKKFVAMPSELPE